MSEMMVGMKPGEPNVGVVVNCRKLNVRTEPDKNSEAICTIDAGAEVIIDEAESTEEFYKVYTETGVEGFCMREYIEQAES